MNSWIRPSGEPARRIYVHRFLSSFHSLLVRLWSVRLKFKRNCSVASCMDSGLTLLTDTDGWALIFSAFVILLASELSRPCAPCYSSYITYINLQIGLKTTFGCIYSVHPVSRTSLRRMKLETHQKFTCSSSSIQFLSQLTWSNEIF